MTRERFYYCVSVCLQVDSESPSSNIAVVNETLSSGILTVDVSAGDTGSGVQYVNILMQTGNSFTDLKIWTCSDNCVSR